MSWVEDCEDLEGVSNLSPSTAQRWASAAELLDKYAVIEGVPLRIVTSVAYVESRFNPAVTSSAGAKGIMQLMPATGAQMAKELDVQFDPYNAENSIKLGAHLLARLRKHYLDKGRASWDWPVAAYFAGMGNVKKHGKKKYDEYVQKVRQAQRAFENTRDICRGDDADPPVWSVAKKKNGKKKANGKKKTNGKKLANGKKPTGVFWVILLAGGAFLMARANR